MRNNINSDLFHYSNPYVPNELNLMFIANVYFFKRSQQLLGEIFLYFKCRKYSIFYIKCLSVKNKNKSVIFLINYMEKNY